MIVPVAAGLTPHSHMDSVARLQAALAGTPAV